MMWGFIVGLIAFNVLLGYLVYTLHSKIQKLSENEAIFIEWFEVLRENEEQLLKDFKRLQYEFHNAKKETRIN